MHSERKFSNSFHVKKYGNIKNDNNNNIENPKESNNKPKNEKLFRKKSILSFNGIKKIVK